MDGKIYTFCLPDIGGIRESIRALAKRIADAGYTVIEAVDGKDALTKLAQPVNMVITDLNMPNVDGIQMIGAVRKLPGYAFTPILMLTTESQAEKKDAGRKAGATGWIVKPFQAEQLIAVMHKLIR